MPRRGATYGGLLVVGAAATMIVILGVPRTFVAPGQAHRSASPVHAEAQAPPAGRDVAAVTGTALGAAWQMVGGPLLVAVAAAAALRSRRGGAQALRRRAARCASDDDFAGHSNRLAFLFPGQGAQSIGMCKELTDEVPEAKALFDEASETLGYDLLQRCLEGPKELLDKTEVSQPAIFVASMAALEKMKKEGLGAKIDEASVSMGLSLGEYSALCFAEALSFQDGVKVTKARGEAMQAAADAVESSMVAVIGLDSETTELLCKKASELSGKEVRIANYLCKGNYAISGDKKACAKAVEIAKPEFKARMAVPLAVAGAFHTDFMAPAVDRLREVLASVEVKKPRIPVVSNVDCKAHSDPETIRQILARQVTSPVLWEKQMQAMVAGDFVEAYEVGPGKVIAGIMKRIDKAAKITNVTV